MVVLFDHAHTHTYIHTYIHTSVPLVGPIVRVATTFFGSKHVSRHQGECDQSSGNTVTRKRSDPITGGGGGGCLCSIRHASRYNS